MLFDGRAGEMMRLTLTDRSDYYAYPVAEVYDSSAQLVQTLPGERQRNDMAD